MVGTLETYYWTKPVKKIVCKPVHHSMKKNDKKYGKVLEVGFEPTTVALLNRPALKGL